MKNNLRFAQFAFTMFLTTALIFCGMPLTKVQAAPAANTDWYSTDKKEFVINTVEELAGLTNIVNNADLLYPQDSFEGKVIKLGNSIDMSPYRNWAPIGTDQERVFKGTFDGCGYEIRNLSMYIGYGVDALFGVTSGATIKNFLLTDVNISFDNLKEGELDRAAGVVANAWDSTIISNVHVTGKIISSGSVAGGVVGLMGKGTKVENCSVSAKVTSATIAGGISGIGDENSKIENCHASGEVSSKVTGGVAGSMQKVEIINCYSTSNVTSSDYEESFAGGILGCGVSNVKIINCYSTGDVKSNSGKSTKDVDVDSAGGIVGSIYGANNEIRNCYSTSNVTSVSHAGGIAGRINSTTTVDSCYATGTITATGTGDALYVNSAGGVVGACIGKQGIKVSNCIALNSSVSTKDNRSHTVGRIVGFIDPADSSVCSNNFGNSSTSLSYGSGNKLAVSNKNGNDGESVSSNLNTAWRNFDSSVWNIESGKLPTLKNVGAIQTNQTPNSEPTNSAPKAGSSENRILSFKIENAEGVVGQDTVLIEVPYGTDLTTVSPTVKVSEGATILQSYDDFSNPVVYIIRAENGETRGYVVTVTVAAPNTTTTATPQTTSTPIITTPPTTSGIDVIINGERENPVAPTLVNSSDAISDSGNTNNSGNTAGAEKENPSTMDSLKDNVIKFSILVIAAGAVVLFTSGTRDDKKKKILNK